MSLAEFPLTSFLWGSPVSIKCCRELQAAIISNTQGKHCANCIVFVFRLAQILSDTLHSERWEPAAGAFHIDCMLSCGLGTSDISIR